MLAETLEKSGAIPKPLEPHLQLEDAAGERFTVLAYIAPDGADPRGAGEPVTAVARDRQKRLVLIEMAGPSVVKIGPRTRVVEARDLALKVLDGNARAISAPETLFKLALAFVGIGLVAADALDRAGPPPPKAAPPAKPEGRAP